MNRICIMLGLLLLMSCAGSPRTYYLKNEQKLNEIQLSQTFSDSVQSYGAYYNKYFTSIECAVSARPFTVNTYHRQMVITDKAGFDYARIYIPKNDYIDNIKIAIKYPNNAQVKSIDVDDLTEVVEVEANAFLDEENYYIYAVPNVQEGMIIDYSYEIKYETIIPFEQVYMMAELPTRSFQFQFILPNTFKHQLSYYNNLQMPDIDENYFKTRTKYEWKMNNILPLKSEAYSVSEETLTPKFVYVINSFYYQYEEHDLFEGWNDVAEYYYYMIDNAANVDSLLKTTFIDSTISYTKEDSIFKIIDFVHDNFKVRYNASDKYDEARNVIKDGFGTSIGITGLVYRMLEKADLKPAIILAKSYERGPIDFDHPNPYEIDNIFLMIDGVIFNAYSEAYPHGIISSEYQDTETFILKNPKIRNFRFSTRGYRWYFVPEYGFDIYKTRIEPVIWKQSGITNTIDIDIENNFYTTMKTDFFGNNAYSIIERLDYFKNVDAKDFNEGKEIQEYVNEQFDDTKVNKYSTFLTNKNNRDFQIKMDITNTNLVKDLGDEKILNIGQFIPKNYLELLTEDDRFNDYDFNYEKLDQIFVNVKIPKGYKISKPNLSSAKIDTDQLYQNLSIVEKENQFTLIYEGGIKNRIVSKDKREIIDQYVKQLSEIRSIQLLLNRTE